jgi:hypothetical protein
MYGRIEKAWKQAIIALLLSWNLIGGDTGRNHSHRIMTPADIKLGTLPLKSVPFSPQTINTIK